MRRWATLPVLAMSVTTLSALVISCGDKGDGTDGTADDTGGGTTPVGAQLSDFIDVTVAASGDFSGFTGGFDAAGAWLSQTVNPEMQKNVELHGEVVDFQEGTSVVDATVEFWFGDAVSGAPSAVDVSDDSGQFVIDNIPTCTPLTYRTTTNPELELTKDTYEAHQIFDPDEVLNEEVNSVSVVTYRLIPGLLGVAPAADKGTIAGTAYDSNGNKIIGAQVVVMDDSGYIPDSQSVHYFVDEFPNREQQYTSEDGLWVAVNVPEGVWNANMYISDGAGGWLLMGATKVEVAPDSINIGNIWTGFGDGVRYPDDCL